MRNLPRLRVNLLALICCASVAYAQAPESADWQRVTSDAPAFSVEIPPGWEFREVEGRGARIVPPENGPVVEVVAWNALRPPATPDKAAIEHEGVLARAVDYRRDGTEQIQTDEGEPALVVTGRVRSRGLTESSIFATYSEGATHFVLGAFAAEEALPEFREQVLDRMIRSFRAEPGAAPVTRPPLPLPEPSEPDTELEPEPDGDGARSDARPEPAAPTEAQPAEAPGTLQVGGQVEPVGPEVREPRAPWLEHLSPRGFSVSIPVDWEVETADGLISLTPAVEAAGSGAVLIWPVTGSDPGAEAALRLALTRIRDIRLLRVTSVEEMAAGTLIEATATGDRRLRATWAHDGAFGLLQVVAAPEVAWESALPKLARMAASFRAGEWQVSYRPQVEATGDMGLLRWKLPAGWQVRGGAREETGEVSIDIEALGPSEDAFRVAWRQPMQPRFRALTPLLESLGWREGERYSVPEEGGGLMIYRRRGPEELVRDILLARHPRQLRLSAIDALPAEGAIAGLLPGADGTGQSVTVAGGSAIGPRERLYLAATASAEPPLSTTAWDAAVLRADAPEGRLGEAVETLVMMVRTAQTTERATPEQSERLEALIARAQQALTGIPGDLQPEPDRGLTSVLDGNENGADAATWTVPEGAEQYWTEEAASEDAIDILGVPAETRPKR